MPNLTFFDKLGKTHKKIYVKDFKADFTKVLYYDGCKTFGRGPFADDSYPNDK